jgi:hypothetical protein
MQTSPITALFDPARLSDMPDVAIRILQSARIAILTQRRGGEPLASLTSRLRNTDHARRMLHLITLAGAIWPEPFMLSPPCCGRLTPDEALLGELAVHANHGDRPAFDRAGRDLISEDGRDQLWRAFNWARSA